jgi:hypothetical protein
MDKVRVCYVCKESKPLVEYHRCSKSKEGHKYSCKVCVSNYHKMDRLNHRQKRLDRDRNWRLNNKEYFCKYDHDKRKTDPTYRATTNLRNATWRLFKEAGKNKDKQSTKILGVGFSEAKDILLRTIPVGYTEQDWLDGKLDIDHKIPLSWYKRYYGSLTDELILEAGSINNLQLLPKDDNYRKKNLYGHLDNGGIISYEEWIKTRQVPTQSH